MWETISLIGGTLLVFATLAAYTTLAERKIAAAIQQRPGPNRVGPWGLLQPLADVTKLILKEPIRPKFADGILLYAAPILLVSLALGALSVIPLSKNWVFFEGSIGILLSLGIASMAVYGVALAGWASASKYALLGGLRSSAQMISYELSMGAAVMSVILLAHHKVPNASALSLVTIVEAQSELPFVLLNPLGAFIFIVCAFAETNRAPFDLVEAEQELVGGYHTEYSGIRFGAFYVAEYMHVIVASALISTLFLGGYKGIGEHALGVAQWAPLWQNLWGVAWLMLKTLLCIFLFIWVRWTLPRFKYNALMGLGWKWLFPLSLLNLLGLAGILLL